MNFNLLTKNNTSIPPTQRLNCLLNPNPVDSVDQRITWPSNVSHCQVGSRGKAKHPKMDGQ